MNGYPVSRSVGFNFFLLLCTNMVSVTVLGSLALDASIILCK